MLFRSGSRIAPAIKNRWNFQRIHADTARQCCPVLWDACFCFEFVQAQRSPVPALFTVSKSWHYGPPTLPVPGDGFVPVPGVGPVPVPVPVGVTVSGVIQISQLPGPGTDDSGYRGPAHNGLQYLLSFEKTIVGISSSSTSEIIRPLNCQFLITTTVSFKSHVRRRWRG